MGAFHVLAYTCIEDNISDAEFVHWCKHKKALFKQREADALLGHYRLGRASNPVPRRAVKGQQLKTFSGDWSFPCSIEITFHRTSLTQNWAGTALLVWRNTWEMWVNPAHWTPLWQSRKQIQNEQHFAWDWNGYTQSTTNMLHKNC